MNVGEAVTEQRWGEGKKAVQHWGGEEVVEDKRKREIRAETNLLKDNIVLQNLAFFH